MDKFEFNSPKMAVFTTIENFIRVEGDDNKHLVEVAISDVIIIMKNKFFILETLFHFYDDLHEYEKLLGT